MTQIAAAQRTDPSRQAFSASRWYYRQAKRSRFWGVSLTRALALASPIVLLTVPNAGPVLGAVGGAWLFVSRLVLERVRSGLQRHGAVAQESFDCGVLGLAWNPSLGKRLSPEEMHSAAARAGDLGEPDNWYTTTAALGWPKSVLVCQRSNAVWGRRQHLRYGQLLIALGALWGLLGVIVSIADGASLKDYLVTVCLPSLPALLDAGEVGLAHVADARDRARVEELTNDLLQRALVSNDDLRVVQDLLFKSRAAGEPVPDWFYEKVKPSFEEDMRYAAEEIARS